MKLLPTLIETETEVKRTVNLKKEENRILVEETDDYRKQSLNKGDRVILDFGDHQVGYVTLDLKTVGSHADAPAWLRLDFAEQPVELFEKAKNYRGWVSSSWIEEEEIHVDVLPSVVKLPRRYAFRYLMIEVIDSSSKYSLVLNKVSCRAVSAADDSTLLPYATKDPYLQKLDRVAVRTLHNCMQTVFEDGPKRDRRLWIGDLRIQALCNYETYRMSDMVKACLYLFAALPMEDGKVGACIFLEPEPEVDDTEMFDYSLFFVDTLYDYYRETNDKETLKELWGTALRQIEIATGQLDERGIVRDSDRLGWCFVDWNLTLNKQASAQAILLYSVKRAADLAAELEDAAGEKKLQTLYSQLKEAANACLWDEERQVYISGSDRQVSWASQVWMVLGGAIEGKNAAELLQRIRTMDGAEGMVTPYMYHNYIDALLLAGEKKKALEAMQSYWGQMVDAGADTYYELFNPDNPLESPYGGTIVNSYCHAWSCGPAYFLRKYFSDAVAE